MRVEIIIEYYEERLEWQNHTAAGFVIGQGRSLCDVHHTVGLALGTELLRVGEFRLRTEPKTHQLRSSVPKARPIV